MRICDDLYQTISLVCMQKASFTQSSTIFDADSQWPVKGDGDNYSEEADDESQLLDANG